MAKKKKKSWGKKLAKAAALGLAGYAAYKGLGRKRATDAPGNAMAAARKAMTSDAAYGKPPYVDAIRRQKTLTPPVDEGIWGSPWGGKKGGRAGKKGGGRTGKQFGGGLGSTARRDMRSGYYPSDMGMRGGTMYKKGGRVKSRGVAKRGGGVEIK